jgi:hypothetical protein
VIADISRRLRLYKKTYPFAVLDLAAFVLPERNGSIACVGRILTSLLTKSLKQILLRRICMYVNRGADALS